MKMTGRNIERHKRLSVYDRPYEKRETEREIITTLQQSDIDTLDNIINKINTGTIRTDQDLATVKEKIHEVGYDKLCSYLIQVYGHR